MNQFETEALRLAAGLFIGFCIAFYFLRHKLVLWRSLPRIVIVTCLAWFLSALIVLVTMRTSLLQGPVFLFAYFGAVLMTPPLLAVGTFEMLLGTYASFIRQDPMKSFPPRWHFIAALSTFACFGAYFILSTFSK